ncbi:MAG: hypothetical protein HY829_09445, partial [Actinobacteria bacterium]|nr:hypothetical protein [Actinomycetota bacterium]
MRYAAALMACALRTGALVAGAVLAGALEEADEEAEEDADALDDDDALEDAEDEAALDAGALLEAGVYSLVTAGPEAPATVSSHPSTVPFAGVLASAPTMYWVQVPMVPSALTGAC